MASYWVNFARTGNPNGKGLPKWEPVTAMQRNEAMLLKADDKSATGATMTETQVELYDALFARDVLKPIGLDGKARNEAGKAGPEGVSCRSSRLQPARKAAPKFARNVRSTVATTRFRV